MAPARKAAAGTVLTLAAPVSFTHHGGELADRLATRLGVRFDLEPVYAGGRAVKMYLRASWTREDAPPVPTLDTARGAGVLGVDLNADHLAAYRIDGHGNPVGAPHTIGFDSSAPAALRDARLREAVVALLDVAEATGAGTVVVEDLGCTDPTAKETTGRGRRGRTFRRTVAGIPTAQLRARLAAMAARRGITVVAVDPRYTSKVGGKAWAARLTTRTTTDVVTRHHGAAVAIARRGLGMRLAPRPPRPAPHPRDGSRPATRGAGAVTRTGGRTRHPSSAPHGQPDSTGPALPPPRAVGNRPARPPTGAGGAHEYRPSGRGTRHGRKATPATDRIIGPICPAC